MNERNFRCTLVQPKIVLDFSKKKKKRGITSHQWRMALVTYHPERPLSWRLFQGVVNNSKDDGEQAPRWRHRDQTPVTNYRRRFFTKKETWLQREKIENRSMKLATYLARLLFQTNTFGKERMLKLSLSRLDQFKFGAFLSHLILNTRFNSFNISSPLSINPIDVSSEKFLTLRLSNSYLLPPLTTSYHCINFIIRAERASL